MWRKKASRMAVQKENAEKENVGNEDTGNEDTVKDESRPKRHVGRTIFLHFTYIIAALCDRNGCFCPAASC